MIPARILSSEVTVVRPAQATDGYGDDVRSDYGAAATRRVVRGMLQPTGGTEVTDDGSRDALVADWLLLTDWLDLDGRDRIEHEGTSFEIVGPVLAPQDSNGKAHHAEARLRVVSG